MRRPYRAAVAILSLVRLRLWAFKTDLRMRGAGGRFKLELSGGRVRFRKLPFVRIRPGGAGGTTTVSIGAGTQLGTLDLDLSAANDALLSIGDNCEFERGVRLQVFGRELVIGRDCQIRDDVTLKTSRPASELHLGAQVRLGRGVEVHCDERVHIDDRVTLSERVSIVDLFHDVDGSDVWTMEQPVGTAPVHIGSNVIVFAGAVIMHGVEIGQNALIGTTSVVRPGTYPAGGVYVGSPAKFVRRLPAAP